MKIKQIIIIMSVLILIHINNISYADVLKGDEAYNAFRIKDYKNIKYNIDTNSTDKYYNHTNAWKNAIDTFSKDTRKRWSRRFSTGIVPGYLRFSRFMYSR